MRCSWSYVDSIKAALRKKQRYACSSVVQWVFVNWNLQKGTGGFPVSIYFPFPSDPVESVKKFSSQDSPDHCRNQEFTPRFYGDEGFGIALRLRAKGSVENFAQKWRGAPGRVIGVCVLKFASFWLDDNEIISIMNMIQVEDKEVRSWAWGFDLPSVWHCGTPRRIGHPQVEVERSEGNARWQAAA